MKIRIIDLLNKIYNNDNIPQKIIYDGLEWIYCDDYKDYQNKSANEEYLYQVLSYAYLQEYNSVNELLNTEVEIIEEPKKIEKLCEYNRDLYILTDDPDLKIKYSGDYNDIAIKINEIIDVVNKMIERSE